MNIIVCIKQVPASSKVSIDKETGVLIRDGNNTKMNPYDLYALECAFKLKEATNSLVTSITMGPPSAKEVLQESLWMGCDDAYLISDRALGGADVVATSYTISAGIKAIGSYDLIICGKQTTDGDTAQVGPEISKCLDIPHICYVDEIIEVKEKSIILRSHMENTYDIYEVTLPCLITIDGGANTPRLPSYLRSKKYEDYQIKVLTLNDLSDTNPDHYGLKGSPTQVEKMFNPTHVVSHEELKGSVNDICNSLIEIIKEKKE